MKPQKSGFKRSYYKVIRPFLLLVSVITGTIIHLSCENDIEKINAITTDLKLPQQTGYDVEIAFTDSGILRWKLYAPQIDRYADKDNPYMEFLKGIRIEDFDSAGNIQSYLTANYAIYYQKKEVGEAKNNVVAINKVTGEQLYTEHLIWDQKAELLHSNTFSKIINEQGIHTGERGFEAKQDMSRWKLIGSKGTVKLKDEQED
ncbi:MAG: LPS export ABC transporter periplasmic protein LptC [Bacteroidales bacterium]|nr:LPS export ABC transporter periplasmic protein LptC [Bacteroidales bacterium]